LGAFAAKTNSENNSEFSKFSALWRRRASQIQWVAGKFPVQSEQGNKSRETAYLIRPNSETIELEQGNRESTGRSVTLARIIQFAGCQPW
jgi:hypothetical protein